MNIKNYILIETVKNEKEGTELAENILYKSCDKKTVLFLSGGSTPKPLYENLAREAKLNLGAVAMVDERFGQPMHPNSNERMIQKTGLLSYFEEKKIPFYSVLMKGLNRIENAKEYDKIVRTLMFNFKKGIAILGIGSNGHTAGIASNRLDFKNPLFNENQKNLFVSEFSDPKSMVDGGFGERITLTFNALSQMDKLIILAFGENKREAIGKMFEKGSLEEIPARFYLTPTVVKKTLLITDQNI